MQSAAYITEDCDLEIEKEKLYRHVWFQMEGDFVSQLDTNFERDPAVFLWMIAFISTVITKFLPLWILECGAYNNCDYSPVILW